LSSFEVVVGTRPLDIVSVLLPLRAHFLRDAAEKRLLSVQECVRFSEVVSCRSYLSSNWLRGS
jgi:hypothetical protein